MFAALNVKFAQRTQSDLQRVGDAKQLRYEQLTLWKFVRQVASLISSMDVRHKPHRGLKKVEDSTFLSRMEKKIKKVSTRKASF